MAKAIFLCGFMGAGKTSVGKALAKKLNFDFLDTDRLIEQKYGQIPQIFAEKGEKYFRQKELELAKELISKENVIISSGGGFVLSEEVQAVLKDSFVIYLEVPFEKCYSRICRSERPLVRNNSKEQLLQIYNRRTSTYNSVSSIKISNSAYLPATVDKICDKLKSIL